MRKFGIKVLLPLLCVMALLCTGCGAMMVSGIKEVSAPQRITAHDLIERDGYLEGVWYPWFTHTYLGSGLTANPDNEERDSFVGGDYWQNFNKVGIDEYGINNIKREIYNLKAVGYNILGYEGSPWGEGIIHDPDTGDVLGVREDYLQNIRRFLDACREVEMPVLWAMCFHTSAAVLYSNLDLWYFVCQMYSNPEITKNYCEKFVKPVCEVLNEYPDVVAMMCSTVELENEINDSQWGNHSTGGRETYGVTQDDAVYFAKMVTEAIREVMPETPITIATNSSDFAMYADCNFDMVGRNQYSNNASAQDLVNYYPTAPILATEWGVDNDMTDDATLCEYWLKFRDNLRAKNYSGWIQWAWEPTARSGGGHNLLKNGAATVYDFRQAVYEQYYYIEEYRADYDSTTHQTGKPSMMYCDGSGSVYWVQPKGVTTYKLERSVNGGAWTTIAENSGATADTSTGGYRYCYIDGDAPSGATVQYRVTVNDFTSTGNTIKLASNLISNGGFENGNTGWTSINSSYAKITTDYARSGSKSLLMNISGNNWGEAASMTKVAVEKNTSYTVSFWAKRISGTGRYALFTKNGGTNISSGCIFFSHTDTDWIYCEATFNTSSYTTVDFRFQANDDTSPGQFAIDDFKLVKND